MFAYLRPVRPSSYIYYTLHRFDVISKLNGGWFLLEPEPTLRAQPSLKIALRISDFSDTSLFSQRMLSVHIESLVGT